jgi:hypothetical protein
MLAYLSQGEHQKQDGVPDRALWSAGLERVWGDGVVEGVL